MTARAAEGVHVKKGCVVRQDSEDSPVKDAIWWRRPGCEQGVGGGYILHRRVKPAPAAGMTVAKGCVGQVEGVIRISFGTVHND